MLSRAQSTRKNKILFAFAGFLAVILISGIVSAAQPQTIGIAGRLTAPGGKVLDGSNYNFTFNIFTAATGGTAIWTERHDGSLGAPYVNVKNGVWSTVLGNNTSLALPWDQTYYLETIINGETLTPRSAFSSVPYTLNATNPGIYNFTDTVAYTGTVTFNGTLTNFLGTGTNFVNMSLAASNITSGTIGNARLDTLIYFMNSTGMNAANITAGTIGNARLDSNLAWINASQVFTGTNQFTGTSAFSGQTNFTGGANGGLTSGVFFNNTTVHFLSDFSAINASIDAANLTLGALPVARISSGTIGNARLDTLIYFMNSTGMNAANITAGTIGNARLDALIYFMNSTGMNAANITAGTIGNARLDSNLAWVNASQTFTGQNAFSGASFTGSVWFNSTSNVTFTNDTQFTGTVQYRGIPTGINISVDVRNITNLTANSFLNHTLLPVFQNRSASYASSGMITQFGNATYPLAIEAGAVSEIIGLNISLGKLFSDATTYTVVFSLESPYGVNPAVAPPTSLSVVYHNGSMFGIQNTSSLGAGPYLIHWLAIGY